MKIRRGDIFTIRMSNEKICIGQVLQSYKDHIYIVVFEGYYSTPVTENQVEYAITQMPAILARTGTTFFNLKRWIKLSNKIPHEKSEYYPNYKIETLDGVFITTFDGQLIRKANKDEEEFYLFHNYESPSYVVGATEAYHDIRSMDDDYSKMTYEFIRKRTNVFN